tara:strand:+ start:3108 stop:3704 length:597 start_codon:yes stop_codon:yes gene_type:complete
MVAVQHKLPGYERIVATAKNLFAQKGFHRTAMSELACEASVSVGQIYRFFASKSDIILAIVSDDVNQRMHRIDELGRQAKAGEISVENALHDLVLQALGEESEEALSFEILAEAHRDAVVAQKIAEMCNGYRASLRQIALIANPRLNDIQLKAAEELLLACLFGFGHHSLSGPCLSNKQIAENSAAMIIGAMRTPHLN